MNIFTYHLSVKQFAALKSRHLNAVDIPMHSIDKSAKVLIYYDKHR